jgi:oligopeptide transport system permease protein
MALRRLRRNVRAVVTLVLVLLIGLATILVPLLSPHAYDDPDTDAVQEGPSAAHWFGTDAIGRDLMARSFMGGRISFAVGLLATAVAVIIGVAWGSIAGFLGGRINAVMMRFVDVLYGLPYILIVIIAMSLFDSRSIHVVALVLGFFSWLTMSRIVRGQVLSLREREFVEAARALGVGTPSIIFRHLIPNLLGPVIVYATLTIPAVMLSAAFLSFLGLGTSEPMTSWGILIDDGRQGVFAGHWWQIVFPGALFALTLYCLNAVGDGIRDAFDVEQR